MNSTQPTHLYTSSGDFLGVFIPYQFWDQLDITIKNALQSTSPAPTPIKEPLSDWEMLKQIWDFPYSVDTDVHCELCGNKTADWEQDSPKRFFLKAANISGLVAFECAHCRARIRKNHFKDGIDVSSTPFTP